MSMPTAASNPLKRRKSAKAAVDTATLQGFAAGSFLSYCKAQDADYQVATHLRVLSDKLQQVAEGKITRLQIFMPPQFGKSRTTSELFIAWFLGKFPTRSLAYASYNSDFAEQRGRAVRDLISSPIHKALFPDSVLSESSSAAAKFSLTATKTGPLAFLGIGRGAGLTGYAIDGIIIDDPLKDKDEAFSEATRKSMHGWFNTAVMSRIKPGNFVIVINTRWHEDDLSGFTLREHAAEGWETVVFPAILEDEQTAELLNGYLTQQEREANKRFEVGGSLWPENWPTEFLLRKKAGISAYEWAALYQQRPYAEAGGLLNAKGFVRYRDNPRIVAQGMDGEQPLVVQSLDIASKAKELNDPSAILTWAVYKTGPRLVHAIAKRWEYLELRKFVETHAKEWGAKLLLIEDKSSGTALMQDLRKTTALPIKAIDPGKRDKQTRARDVSYLLDGGRVYIPEGETGWVGDFVAEIAAFPAGRHDDQVDALTQFLEYYIAQEMRWSGAFYAAGPRRTSNLLAGF
ncbi:phage terminase large subunit [Burkholderia pseudomallei]|uniref:phage terminase large subunit n=1 Tax=Burkholderia pseudomallei TaxID=28450 RepID=UPI00193DC63C|nr:phage terminase large subunit [Burkholderia pseudomallei]QRM23528.1 phage terminase large subunit [Burkholderia pseudomallei]